MYGRNLMGMNSKGHYRNLCGSSGFWGNRRLLANVAVVAIFILLISELHKIKSINTELWQRETTQGQRKAVSEKTSMPLSRYEVGEVESDKGNTNLGTKRKICPEKLMEDMLAKQSFERKIITQSTTERYLTYQCVGGLNNCLISLEKALVIATNLNRTLLVPFIESDHQKSGPGSAKSIYKRLEYGVEREGLSFNLMQFKNYSRSSPKDVMAMKSMSFRTYFRFRQYKTGAEFKMRLEDGLTDSDDRTPGMKRGKVAFMEDNPEFWASKIFLCPRYSAGFSNERPFFTDPAFKYAQEHHQFMCLGKSFSMVQSMGPDSLEYRYAHLTSVLFSDVMEKITAAVLASHDLEPYKYVGIHNRRGDFEQYCESLAKRDPEMYKHCFPSYERLQNHVLTIPKTKELKEIFHVEGRSLGVNMKQMYPVFAATNEMDPKVLENLREKYGWETLKSVCTSPSDKECKGVMEFPFLRPALDANILYRSGVFIWNNYSTLSKRIVGLRRLWSPQGGEIWI